MLVFFPIILFIIGLGGVFLCRKNLIIVLMCLELCLLAVNMLFISFSLLLDDFFGLFVSLFILVIGAVESSVGLSLIIAYFMANTNY